MMATMISRQVVRLARLVMLVAGVSAALVCVAPLAWAQSMPSDIPSVGALFERDFSGQLSLRCSGVLVAPDVVLTAAHCLSGKLPIDAGRFLFVPARRPFPLTHNAYFEGRSARISPGFELRRLTLAPLFMRAPEGEGEVNALLAIEKRCGKRDANLLGQQEWLRCLTAQSPELQRAVGLRDSETGEDDIALLFLRPNKVNDAAQDTAFVPRDAIASIGDPAIMADTKSDSLSERGSLLLVGYGLAADAESRGMLQLFRPIERHQQLVRVERAGTFQFQLSEGVTTCEDDAGAGIFRRHRGAAPELVGLLSRRNGQDGNCGQYAMATSLAHYWPWIEATLREACLRGERASAACPTQSTNNEARPKRKAKS